MTVIVDGDLLDYFRYRVIKENLPYLPKNWTEAKNDF